MYNGCFLLHILTTLCRLAGLHAASSPASQSSLFGGESAATCMRGAEKFRVEASGNKDEMHETAQNPSVIYSLVNTS